ncbi:hypothetical protein [Methylomonas rhizoryzae]|uniref:hypothetical protein n=1 Tax=Methylomonas rhizoryzae TaxID=2608981 RepID=UPI001232666A|nr:hypothetical protein [Methylomonas rhizoryzae]
MGQIVSDFFAKLIEWITYGAEYFAGVIAGLFEAMLAIIKNLLFLLFSALMTIVEGVIDGSGISTYLGKINTNYTGALGYFLELFQVPQAVSALGLAYIIRFAIRRLPVVG